MELIQQLIDFILHFDDHLRSTLENYGSWTYAALFLIVFCETGLVVTPFLPGDSLLFAAGTFAGSGELSLPVLLILLVLAAVAGDAVNYAIGHRCGETVLRREKIWLIKRKHIDMATAFYERHGGQAIVLARFVPIVRTFVPFVAGAGRMGYPRFMVYNLVGAVAWVGLCTTAGYFFGQIPVVRENFSLVAMGIVAVSVLPIGVEFLRSLLSRKPSPAAAASAASRVDSDDKRPPGPTAGSSPSPQ